MATRRLIARPVAALLALLAAVTFVPSSAVAEPGATVADARRELSALNREVDAAVEDYSEARIALTTVSRQAAAARARVARAEAQLRAVQQQMGALAAAAYRGGGTDAFVSLVTTSTPQTFLDRATTLDGIARSQAAQLRAIRVARRHVQAEQLAADRAVAEQRAVERRLRAVRRVVEAKVARQEVLLNQLETAAARRARLARAAATQRRATRSVVRPTYTGSATGRARIAVQTAVAQLGKPYRWGADGPDSFDCSGLTMYAWGKAGVSLPHSSRMQFNEGVRVSRSDLRPGDLVFFGHPIHHVGMYVGNNQYIAAPQTGDVVSYRSMGRGDYAGAVRL